MTILVETCRSIKNWKSVNKVKRIVNVNYPYLTRQICYKWHLKFNVFNLYKIYLTKVIKKKLSRYTPWRHMGGEEL
jgi:hypothetical protein